MTQEMQDFKTQVNDIRAEIAHLENVRAVRAAKMTTEEFEAISKELEAKRKQLDKVTKAAAKALKLKKPARI